MKVAIIANRKNISYKEFCRAVQKSGFNISEVVIYEIKHHIFLPKKYAEDNNIEYTRFKPDEEKHKSLAFVLCNKELLRYVDAVIFINCGNDKNTIKLSNYAHLLSGHIKLFYYNIMMEK